MATTMIFLYSILYKQKGGKTLKYISMIIRAIRLINDTLTDFNDLMNLLMELYHMFMC